ncbi:MAG TPA: hypothetical protein VM425_20720 [Myxococcota bacterium]|nr:hypothetical protein [Myxococcota bacterium]
MATWRTRLAICACLLSVGLAGCVHTYRFYDGPKREAAEVALVKGGSVSDAVRITIVAVEDKILNMNYGKFAVEYQRVEVPPGAHRILAAATFEKAFKNGPRRLNKEVTIDAKAGRVYQLYAKLDDKRKVHIWFKDVSGD